MGWISGVHTTTAGLGLALHWDWDGIFWSLRLGIADSKRYETSQNGGTALGQEF